MSRFFVAVGILLSVGCGHASAQTADTSTACYNDKILNTNGLNIRMGSGQIFQAYPGSSARIAFWTPLDKVTVCRIGGSAVEITNLNRKNQQVKALRKFN